jgi:hypothetical protein
MKMKVKATVKPSRPSLIVGLIAIGFMIGFGIFFMSLIAGEEESWMGMVFLSMWLLIALLIAGAMLYNYFKKDDAPAIGGEITFTEEETQAAPTNFEGRLRQLERLHKEQLITEAEYQKKRREIMDSKW